MSLFGKSCGETVFVKRSTSMAFHVKGLRQELERSKDTASRKRLERDIRLFELGLKGEEQIMFELENSHLPLYVIRDLNLEHEGLRAQIDFFIIAPYVNIVIECKNLVGNIAITEHGDFVREVPGRRGMLREGIYSPVTQNARHLELLRSIRLSDPGFLQRRANRIFFDDIYKAIVVLANPKSILNDSKAPEEIRQQVIRADRLVSCIEQLNSEGKKKGNGKSSGRDMQKRAEGWLSRHVDSVKCPRCGKPMARRRVKRGQRVGKEIWGCSEYPRCRCVIDID